MVFLLSACAEMPLSNFNDPFAQAETNAQGQSVEPVDVYLAGVSFTGNYSDRKRNYPYASELADQLDRKFAETLSSYPLKNVVLHKELGDIRNANSVAVTLGINQGTIASTKVPGYGVKTVIDIYAELFFFDFSEKKIIRSVPINYQYIALSDKAYTKAQLRAVISNLYYGKTEGLKENLLEYAARELANVRLQESAGARVRIAKVEFSEEASKKLKRVNVKLGQFEVGLAQMLQKSLTDNLKISVVPYTKGEAIGAKMPARFANGSSYMFELPQADYEFALRIKDLRTVRDTESSQSVDTEAYFVYLDLAFSQPDLSKNYMNRHFRAFGTSTPIKGQQTVLSLAYQETMGEFLEGFAETLRTPSDEWLETVVAKDQVQSARKDIRAVRKILEKAL